MDAHDHPEGGVGPLQLLAQEPEADVVHARAAVALGDRRAEEAQLAHLAEGRQVDLVSLVPLADVGQDLRLGEGARGVPHEAVLRAQLEVDHVGDAPRGSAAQGRAAMGGVDAAFQAGNGERRQIVRLPLTRPPAAPCVAVGG